MPHSDREIQLRDDTGTANEVRCSVHTDIEVIESSRSANEPFGFLEEGHNSTHAFRVMEHQFT